MIFPVRRGNALVCLSHVSRVLGALALSVVGLNGVDAKAQTPAAALARPSVRIVEKIDEAKRVTLTGNTHPLANKAGDRGAVADGSPMRRMVMTLSHSDDQEKALVSLMAQQQDRTSPQFHQWLTPETYGAQFGASDADLAAVTTWLLSQGFNVDIVHAGRNAIEFSGTAGQVKKAFQTEIHKFDFEGATYQANASDPSIPAALAPVVKGVIQMHNFPHGSNAVKAGTFRRDKATGQVTKLSGADITAASLKLPDSIAAPAAMPVASTGTDKANPNFTYTPSSSTYYALTPYDFATIYNILPLWNAGIDGTGQTIAIVQESNIHLDDVRAFRSMFNLPANDPQVILNGPDPGVVGDEGEADIDVQWSGAVAKGATIKLVVTASTEASYGVALSALYIVNNNTAPIFSYSYGECELATGTSLNTFYNTLYQQAASQGISAFVSTGDSGSAVCNRSSSSTAAQPATLGVAVNGWGSTPYNTAVGGTDFLGSAFAPSTYWSPTNNSLTQASALSYIPETTWNDNCTNPYLRDVTNTSGGFTTSAAMCQGYYNSSHTAFNSLFDTIGGSGGVSACTTSNGSTVASCSGGWPKPSWQNAVGVPADGKRDVPDVSMMASNGFFGSFYIVCEEDVNTDGKPCNTASPYADFGGYGGTSVSTPAFAGIMALINQKTNAKQGLANYVLYDLFNQQVAAGTSCSSGYSTSSKALITPASSCVFNDTTYGNNSSVCTSGSPNCTVTGSNHYGILTVNGTDAYTNTVGYDLATGLGSVNATNLVNAWTNITFVPTSTSLSLSQTSFAHGTSINATVAVSPTSGGSGVPTGNIELLTSTTPASLGYVALSSGSVVGSYNNLPGGTYTVSAHYAGDGTYAASDSTPVSVTVTSENSTTTGTVYLENESSGAISTVSSAAYGAVLYIAEQVAGASGNGVPTGSVVIKSGSNVVTTAALNTTGEADYNVSNLSPGTYSLVGTYSGDSSFNASTSATTNLTITQAPTKVTLTRGSTSIAAGASVVLTGAAVGNTSLANGGNFGNNITGTVSFYSGGSTLLGTAPITTYTTSASTGATTGTAKLTVSNLPYSTTATSSDSITAVYSGDTNYATSTSTAGTITVAAAAKTATTSSLTASSNPVSYGSAVQFTLTVSSGSGSPTGTVSFYVDGVISGSAVTLSGGSAGLSISPVGGAHAITATYSGDTNFLGSSGALSETVTPVTTAFTLTTPAAATVAQGTAIFYTATVPYTAATPTGTVTFSIDGVVTGIPIAVSAFTSGGLGSYFSVSTLTPGSHTIGAAYSGDKNYAAASASKSVTISAAPYLALSVAQRTAIVLGAPVTINVAAQTLTSGPIPTGSVTYKVDGGAASSAISLTNGTTTLTLSGLSELQHTIVVTYSGDSIYTSVSQTIVLNGDVAQTILFRGLSNRTYSVAPTLSLAARSTSGLPVTYTVTGPATLSGSILTITGTGTITVTASQAGNSSFAAATPVIRSFVAQ